MTIQNAGKRLWAIQKNQGTGLCFGVDPHFEGNGVLNGDFYRLFASDTEGLELEAFFAEILEQMNGHIILSDANLAAQFLAGVTRYSYRLIDAAWGAGIRVFKPQAAFFEQLPLAGQIVLSLICNRISKHAAADASAAFKVLDAKRGDIETTQLPFYSAYLSDWRTEVIPGINGMYDFDTMTVTTWMGENVLSPGLPFFKAGKGAIVVTRSSNPSGTTLQDMAVAPSHDVVSEAQKPFVWDPAKQFELADLLCDRPSAHQVMLFKTTRFSRDNELDEDGVSPIFSVMGSTVTMDSSFRKIRGDGAIALVPGFGAQGGEFSKIHALLVRKGPLAGHWGMLSSSRAHNFPWMPKYGGSGQPKNLEVDVIRAVDTFRQAERQAYAQAHADYPY